ncbi:MAG: DUF1549 domain-containing protein, partial [Acidobacteriia bacterium]|nr:DUF1549 domain-containing protein [Terriglobia bacterium]
MPMQIPSIIFGAVVLLASAAPSRGATNEEIFQQRMRPVLAKNCGGCHQVSNPSGGLNMAGLETLLAGGKHGPALVPGSATTSLLVQYLRGEKSPKMPLGQTLPAPDEAELVRAIDAMQPLSQAVNLRSQHAAWLFQKPVVPMIPAVRRADRLKDQLKDQLQEWIANPIDAFLLHRLEANGLHPAPAASRRALIRRLYFDLIGLPPTPDQVHSFVNDPSPEAYEKLVDRLLDDPNYGERWGRHWLDLARFAESDGFAIDGERPTAWRYRDYVIRAFNQDKPYDLFVKEQLAGDELNDKRAKPEDRSERIIALGFLRMGTWEADANFKTQLRQDFLNDVASTASQVFLGLTTGCARCHDHKYDPIPQKDFYRLQAFFAATKVDDRAAPHLSVEDPIQMKQLLRQHEDESEEAAKRFKQVEEEYKRKFSAAKNLKPGDKAADDFRRALKDARDSAYTAEERKIYEAARDDARRLADAMPRYRPLAYSVSDVVPPQVPSVAETYLLQGGELAGKGEKVEPGFPQCITGKSQADDLAGKLLARVHPRDNLLPRIAPFRK